MRNPVVDNTVSIVLGGLILGVTFFGIKSYGTESYKKSLKNHQTVIGTVIDENFEAGLLNDAYVVSIKKEDGNKIAVNYNTMVTGWKPRYFNTLFARGDKVEMKIAEQPDVSGNNQRYVGIEAKLLE